MAWLLITDENVDQIRIGDYLVKEMVNGEPVESLMLVVKGTPKYADKTFILSGVVSKLETKKTKENLVSHIWFWRKDSWNR